MMYTDCLNLWEIKLEGYLWVTKGCTILCCLLRLPVSQSGYIPCFYTHFLTSKTVAGQTSARTYTSPFLHLVRPYYIAKSLTVSKISPCKSYDYLLKFAKIFFCYSSVRCCDGSFHILIEQSDLNILMLGRHIMFQNRLDTLGVYLSSANSLIKPFFWS